VCAAQGCNFRKAFLQSSGFSRKKRFLLPQWWLLVNEACNRYPFWFLYIYSLYIVWATLPRAKIKGTPVDVYNLKYRVLPADADYFLERDLLMQIIYICFMLFVPDCCCCCYISSILGEARRNNYQLLPVKLLQVNQMAFLVCYAPFDVWTKSNTMETSLGGYWKLIFKFIYMYICARVRFRWKLLLQRRSYFLFPGNGPRFTFVSFMQKYK